MAGDDKATARYFLQRNRDEREGQGKFDFTRGGGKLPEQAPLAHERQALRAMPEESPADIVERRLRFEAARAERSSYALGEAADLYIAAFLQPKTGDPLAHGQVPMVPTTGDVWRALADKQANSQLVAHAVEASRTARAFHWPLEFPDVMLAGGFDVVLGNPPWERIKLQEQEFFASREPEIAAAPNAAARRRMISALAKADSRTRERALYEEFETAKRLAEASSTVARESGRFPHTGRGDINTYALFAELFSSLVSPRGWGGVIVPTGIATDATTAPFFAELVDGGKLAAVFSFENEEMIFPAVHHAMKFCLLVMGPPRQGINPEFVFFARAATAISDSSRRFALSATEIARINPNTKTAPVFRSRDDAELTARIYARCQPIESLSGRQSHDWHLTVRRFLDMNKQEFMNLVTSEPGSSKIPVYEGKLFWQFDHRHATYRSSVDAPEPTTQSEKSDPDFNPSARYWIERDEFAARLRDAGWTRDWVIGLRDLTNTTNERTIIASAFPLAGTDYTVRTLLAPDYRNAVTFLSCANTIVFDFVARTKLGGMHLAGFVFKQLPILPASFYSDDDFTFILQRVLELTYTSHSMASFARDLDYYGVPFKWDEDRRALIRAELDAWYARAYGLTRDELRYVLDPVDMKGAEFPSETFRVLKANEIRRFGEFRTGRLVIAAYDKLSDRRAAAE